MLVECRPVGTVGGAVSGATRVVADAVPLAADLFPALSKASTV